MAGKQTFKTTLIKSEDSEATGIKLPFDIEDVWGAKRVKVKAVINGVEYRGSAVRMSGEYWMGVPKAFRDAAGINGGDHIEVTMERDDEERVVALSDDLASAIEKAGVREAWDSMSYSKQKSNALAVSETKGAELRAKKVQTIVTMLQFMKIEKNLTA